MNKEHFIRLLDFSNKIKLDLDMFSSTTKHWFFEIEIVELLSHMILVAFICSWPKSFIIFFSQINWFTTDATAMYSASAVDSIVVSCFLELQLKKLVPKEKRYPNVLLDSSTPPPPSLSDYLIRFIVTLADVGKC